MTRFLCDPNGSTPPDDGPRWAEPDTSCDGCSVECTTALVELRGGGLAALCAACQRREERLKALDAHEAARAVQRTLGVGP